MMDFDWQWFPAESPRGVLVICHGMAEHHARYTPLAQYMVKHGWHVLTFDHPGHGSKADQPGYFGPAGWDAVTDRMAVMLTEAATRAPDLPLWLVGHSMGSFAVLDYACRFPLPTQCKGIALIATDSPQTLPSLALAGVTGLLGRVYGWTTSSKLLKALTFEAFNRHFKPNRTSDDWVCGDAAVVDAYQADPLCGFDCSIALWSELSHVFRRLSKNSHLKNLPASCQVVLLAGGKDPVGRFGKGPRALTQRLRKLGYSAELKLYPSMRHEILNEKDKSLVWADFQRMVSDLS
ncbi:alpha/beta hydrolase [Salinispirillum sp. LH 10-3-1]|uniref:Alpha/beta hydrolase n=1 Tax=Salinispirillum sp. LH 10-3-1 TaxID=2952525 RepID=A0AB38YFP9_9GAMM